jgi:hypothetical protein
MRDGYQQREQLRFGKESFGHRMMPEAKIVRPAMSLEDDIRRVEEHVAEARRLVQRQRGVIVRLRAAGESTLDAQRILWLLESNLRRFEEHRDLFRANVERCGEVVSGANRPSDIPPLMT